MGFDLHGDSGNDFSANVWVWRPIVQLIARTGVLDDPELEAIRWNEGYHLSADKALQIAKAMEQWASVRDVDTSAEEALGIHADGRLCDDPGCSDEHPWSAGRGDIAEFVSFCRESGGFEVW